MLIVTLATDTDLDDVLALDAECFPPGRPDRQPADDGELEEGIRRSAVILARADRRTVGYLHAEYTPKGALEIRGVAVTRRFQRRGAGSALINHCLATAMDGAGRLPEILVLTSPLNHPMLALLFRHGFVGRRLRRDYFGPGRHRLACYLTDLQPRTGPPVRASLGDLFARLADGRSVVTGLHRDAPGGPVSYRLAPIVGADHDSSGLDTESDRAVSPDTRSQSVRVVTECSASTYLQSMSTTRAVSSDRFVPGAVTRNEQAPWDRFDPNAYYHNNYTFLREDDKAILTQLGAFFSGFYSRYRIQRPAHALDIGSGANLYPAMAMLPWSTHITLADHSPPNRPWLERAIDEPQPGSPWAWSPFWQVLAQYPGYDSLERPEQQLLQRHRKGQLAVEDLDILDMPEKSRWDLGTMFFVAESITEDYAQFTDAIRNFLRALRPGSPFAAAFMVGSGGYPVKGIRFPAVKTDADDIESHFTGRVAELWRHDIPKLNKPLRDHDDDKYDGMMLLVGVTEHS